LRILLLAAVALASLLSSPSFAKNKAFNFTCSFLEKLADQPWQVVDSRSYAAPFDTAFQFSMGNFSYRLTATQLHDTIVRIDSWVNCQSFPSRNFLDEKIVFKGAALFFDSALVRGNSVYRIKLAFDSIGTQRNTCSYAFGDSSFSFDPSGDFDFYYIKNTLGDYHWNSIRDVFEQDYNGLVDRFQMTDRTKTYFYICPCPPRDIGWDDRWDNGYDFQRHCVFAHYDHGINGLQPEVVYMLRLMRIYGYAPSFILEGAASSLEYCEVFTQDDYKNKRLPDITKLGESGKFRAVDRKISSYAAGSFVNFVFNTRGKAKFLDWYQSATDLTLAQSFEKSFGEPMTAVANEWHQYLDTLKLNSGSLSYYSSRAQSFLKYPEMIVYAEKARDETGDTTWSLQSLSSLYYTFGDYAKACKALVPLLSDTSKERQSRVFYANMLLAMGKLDSAKSIYESYQSADTSVHVVYYKLGLIAESRGQYAEALRLFRKALDLTKSPSYAVDYDLLIGDVFKAMNQPDSARGYYQLAMDNSKLLVGAYNDNSLHHLRLGKAAVRLNSPDLADTELQLALFLEERMFYIGQILLTQGELLDLKKDRKGAIAEYKRVLDLPCAYLEQEQARRRLKAPYRN
jgi:tetratricopeptide (TPR) repeat protein